MLGCGGAFASPLQLLSGVQGSLSGVQEGARRFVGAKGDLARV